MPLQLPNLDDRRYADLMAEARRLIPVFDPAWTNHNPSDPGITVVELFAYLTEMLLYRLDRVTADNQRRFLKLLNGPDWTPGTDLREDIRSTVRTLRARERAISAADYERLATGNFNQWLAAMQRLEQEGEPLDEWWRVTRLDPADAANRPSGVLPVARAACITSRNLERGTEAERTEYAPAHVSLIALPRDAGVLQPPAGQKTALWGYLEERRTLTTRHHVVGPYYAPVGAEIIVASTSGALTTAVASRVVEQIARFLSPVAGGASGDGWPFGRDVYVSELFEQIEAIEGVDYVIDLMLFSQCLAADEQCVAAPAIWHPEGDLVGVQLAPHHLPRLAQDHLPATPVDLDPVIVAPGTSCLPVRLAVTLTKVAAADTAVIKRQAKTAVREFFHPRYHGPGPGTTADTDLALADLKTALAGITGVSAVALSLLANPARLRVEGGQVVGLHVVAGETVNWQTRVTVQEP